MLGWVRVVCGRRGRSGGNGDCSNNVASIINKFSVMNKYTNINNSTVCNHRFSLPTLSYPILPSQVGRHNAPTTSAYTELPPVGT